MSALPMIIMIAAVVVLMTFMSRKQKRTMQAQQDLQSSLTIGDRVMTTSGLYGTVVNTDDDSTIDIEIAPGMTTTWLRAAVREKVDPTLDEGPEVEQIDDELEDEVVDSDAVDTETADADDETAPSKKGR
ncbi:preprotein translocase subunit YajC [Labedaea rhizosphaerae]|uniref:Preprotein translocase subunit YajC n=1 Tax=Labedaea rhizosphaerae TaxID=598644 RepID=A0A4R6SJW8_LABRH|nr:preprotein translocase subunit YajC [Labedaea rhizosphaerae]TDQ01308.1 preprotein translocase subunit YajC [Labedaea rhizosphaerae]